MAAASIEVSDGQMELETSFLVLCLIHISAPTSPERLAGGGGGGV